MEDREKEIWKRLGEKDIALIYTVMEYGAEV